MAQQTQLPPRSPVLTVLTVVAIGMLVVAIGMVFFYVPTDAIQGPVPKIFYLHLGAFMGGA